MSRRADRGQLVLLAAALVVAALVPMTLAYQQLAYQPDVVSDDVRPADDVARAVLSRGVTNASVAVDGTTWSANDAAAERAHRLVDESIAALERPRPETDRRYRISYNATAAEAWTTLNCPYGPNRQFDSCTAFDGVVLQDRTDEVTLLVVAVDVHISSPEESTTLTLLLRP